MLSKFTLVQRQPQVGELVDLTTILAFVYGLHLLPVHLVNSFRCINCSIYCARIGVYYMSIASSHLMRSRGSRNVARSGELKTRSVNEKKKTMSSLVSSLCAGIHRMEK